MAAAANLKGLAGNWTLSPIAVPGSHPQESFSADDGTEGGESIFDPDHRSLVDERDYKDGGKYRSIVKLQMRYKNQTEDDEGWGMGSGWLIRPDLLVTAGHVVFDWAKALGPAVIIKAYIGYHGKDYIGTDASVQFRSAKRIVTTAEWLTSRDNRANDVAFVQLDRPFTGDLRLFSYEETPVQGRSMLGVVGYPADRKLKDERGAQMYEEFVSNKFDLNADPQHMLTYKISTYGGQSGSPVLLKTDSLVPIGTHVYGGGVKNSGSAIGGRYGNPYANFVACFSRNCPVVTTVSGINIIKPLTDVSNLLPDASHLSINVRDLSTNTSYLSTNASHLPTNVVNLSTGDAEGWVDILKIIGSVGAPIASNILQIGSPFLGPLGAPLAAVGSVALNAVSKLCESSMDGPTNSNGAFTGKSGTVSFNGCAERAVLSEAALQTVLGMDFNAPEASIICKSMEKTYRSLAPKMQQITPLILPHLAGPAVRFAVDDLRRTKGGQECFMGTVRRPLKNAQFTESGMNPEEEGFMQGLLAPTFALSGEEGFFDSLGDIIKKGFEFGKPFLREGINYGVGKLLGESAMGPEANTEALDLICRRAMMGEAALQAVMNVPREKLDQLKIVRLHTEAGEEGFFDSMKSAMQAIGRKVMQTAPEIIKALKPVVINMLQDPSNSVSGNSERLEPTNPKQLKTRRSIMSVYGAASVPGAASVANGTLQVSAMATTDVFNYRKVTQHPIGFISSGARPRLERRDSNEDTIPFAPL